MQLSQCESNLRARGGFEWAEQHQLFHSIDEEQLDNELYLYSVSFRDAFYAECFKLYGHTNCVEKIAIRLEAIADRIWKGSGFGEEFRESFHDSDLLDSMMQMLINCGDIEQVIMDGDFKYVLGNIDGRKRTKQQRLGMKFNHEYVESGCEDLQEFFRLIAERSFCLGTAARNAC